MALQYRLSNELDINPEFKRVLKLMEESGSNVMITGQAGTGKSTLLQYFRSVTRKNVAVLAPTGVAALNVHGQTIHSFFRFKPDITPDTVRRLGNASSAIYRSVDMLIIDEISMVRADLLDCIDRFMRLNGRNSSLPFGGTQLVFFGDLYQLPPVVTKGEEEIFTKHYDSQYFFDSKAFKSVRFEFAELKTHYRQADRRFIEILNAIRNNTATDAQISALNERYDPYFLQSDSETYITLTSTNALADRINENHLARVPGRAHTYQGSITGDFNRKLLPADERLSLKEGAQVMLLNNDQDKRWVNGSVGRVESIRSYETGDEISVRLLDGGNAVVVPYMWEVFRFSYDPATSKLQSSKIGSFTQYPIMLAWAVTIHKSQGKTFDNVIIDVGEGTFAHGQLYVALSRCRTLEGLVLKRKLERRHIIMDRRVVDFLAKLRH